MQIIRYSIWLAKSHWYICFIGATVTNSDIVEKTTLYIKCVTCTNAHTTTLFGIQSINYYRMAIHRHSHILCFFLSNWCISKYMELIESKWIKNRNRICSLQVSKHERRNDDENWRIEKFLLNLYLTPLACWYLNRCNLTQHISPVQINHLPNPLHLPYIKWPCFKQHMPNVKKRTKLD